MTVAPRRLLIAGGGLSGCLAALAVHRARPDVEVHVVEQEDRLGGRHLWSFFDTDVDPADRAIVADCVVRRWDDHEVRFPGFERRIAIGYQSVRSSRLDSVVRQTIPAARLHLGRRIAELAEGHVLLEDGTRIAADAVVDARGPGPMPGLDLGWQKFIGRDYRFDHPHGIARPVIMDATIPQSDGYRFIYRLPFGDRDAMIEDTYYSDGPDVDGDALDRRLDADARALGAGEARIEGEETGSLPVVIAGDAGCFWPAGGPQVARLGLAGGFFHQTTGYSLPDAVRNAAILAAQSDLSTPALHRLFRDRSHRLWKERRFFRLLNRMLFRAADPLQRYRVLAHFYRMPEPTIARFYASQLSTLDKVRILSGRPPVPVGRAIRSLAGRA